MKLETLQQLWSQKYGNDTLCDYAKNVGGCGKTGIVVTYQAGGKIYNYSGTVYAIAERNELIPELPAPVDDAKRVFGLLKTAYDNGQNIVIESHNICSNTLRNMWYGLGDTELYPEVSHETKQDVYDRYVVVDVTLSKGWN